MEGVPDPVDGLLQQFTAAGEALAGEAWNTVVAAVDRASAQSPALQRPAARLAALLSLTVQALQEPVVLSLDNLERSWSAPTTTIRAPRAIGGTTKARRCGAD